MALKKVPLGVLSRVDRQEAIDEVGSLVALFGIAAYIDRM